MGGPLMKTSPSWGCCWRSYPHGCGDTTDDCAQHQGGAVLYLQAPQRRSRGCGRRCYAIRIARDDHKSRDAEAFAECAQRREWSDELHRAPGCSAGKPTPSAAVYDEELPAAREEGERPEGSLSVQAS